MGSASIQKLSSHQRAGGQHGIGYVSGMFDGHIDMVEPLLGIGTAAFDFAMVQGGQTESPAHQGSMLLPPGDVASISQNIRAHPSKPRTLA